MKKENILGFYSANNISAIQDTIPSLLILDKQINRFEIILFNTENKQLNCFGSITLAQNGNDENSYSVSGYSGANYGFGELLYTIALMELNKRNACLEPDERGLSEDALKFYKKMEQYSNVSVVYDEGTRFFKLNESINDSLLLKILKKNLNKYKLSEKDMLSLKDQSYDLGEHLLEENNIIDRKQQKEDFLKLINQPKKKKSIFKFKK